MNSKNETRHLLTVEHVSEITTLSKRTIWRLQRENKMPPPVAIGKKNVRWRRVDIMRWIELKCPDMDEFGKVN